MILGKNVYSHYTGSVVRSGGGGTGGEGTSADRGDSGWADYESEANVSTGESTGDPQTAIAVIDRFVAGGGCTKGWDLWVDGLQQCFSGGQ